MNTLTDLIRPRLPRRPYCTDNLSHGLIIRGQDIATTKSHLQLNPAALRHWLLFDIDVPLAALAWERANLPPPNWIAVNPDNSHVNRPGFRGGGCV
ncbi:replication initiation protein [Thauera aromatica]|nr:replication initiation protein [Thauera aromatica]